jgi:hypothetical protein
MIHRIIHLSTVWEAFLVDLDEDVLRGWRRATEDDLRALRDRMAPLEAELRAKEEQLAAIDRLLALQRPELASSPMVEGERRTGEARGASSFLDAAAAHLAKEGAPLHYREIHSRVVAAGREVPGRDGAANLLAHIGRDPRFVRVGRGTYALAEWRLAGLARRKRRKRGRKR